MASYRHVRPEPSRRCPQLFDLTNDEFVRLTLDHSTFGLVRWPGGDDSLQLRIHVFSPRSSTRYHIS